MQDNQQGARQHNLRNSLERLRSHLYKAGHWDWLSASPRYGWLSLLLAMLRERQRIENVAAHILSGEQFEELISPACGWPVLVGSEVGLT